MNAMSQFYIKNVGSGLNSAQKKRGCRIAVIVAVLALGVLVAIFPSFFGEIIGWWTNKFVEGFHSAWRILP